MQLIVSLTTAHRAQSYPISIGNGDAAALCANLLSTSHPASKIVMVWDPTAHQNFSPLFPNHYKHIVLPTGGEALKVLTTVEKLWEHYAAEGLDRHSVIIHIGGGALIDVASFATTTYMRGVRFINIPTTLLSQVDSCIGGKNGINFKHIKNLVGTFAQPEGVIIDTAFLETLSSREFNSGCSEIIKHGIIANAELFRTLRTVSLPLEAQDLQQIIFDSCKVKATIVEKDPYEKNIRKHLNFGHTVGHALESYYLHSTTPLLHGEAISLGMVAEAHIAVAKNLLPSQALLAIEDTLNRFSLPVRRAVSGDKTPLLSLMKSDKKNEGDKILCALPNAIGSCRENIEVSFSEIESSLLYLSAIS